MISKEDKQKIPSAFMKDLITIQSKVLTGIVVLADKHNIDRTLALEVASEGFAAFKSFVIPEEYGKKGN